MIKLIIILLVTGLTLTIVAKGIEHNAKKKEAKKEQVKEPKQEEENTEQ